MNKSVLLALGLLVAIIVWMLTGSGQQAEDVDNQPIKKDETLMAVVVETLMAKPVARLITVQGDVEANRMIRLKAEVSGKVTGLPVALGDRIKADTVLVNLSLQTLLADRAQALANLTYQEQELAATKQLFNKKLESGNRLSLAQANVEAAKATLKKVQHDLENTNIKAPFSGVFDRRFVELGAYVAVGDEILSLVDDEKVKVVAMVPQQQIESLSLGQQVNATLSGGETLTGKLVFISATADIETRSYRVEVSVDNSAHQRIVGMTASLSIPVKKTQAQLINASSLSLDKAGNLQVKGVDKDNQVVVYSVDILRTEADKIWVSGLPDTVTIITLGQNFVVAGQKVAIKNNAKESS